MPKPLPGATSFSPKDPLGLYKRLFESMSSGVAIYEAVDNGQDFRFVDFNPAGERIDDISRDQVIGRRVTEAFPAVKEFGLLEVFRRVWKTGVPEDHPVSLYQDGRVSGWRDNHVFKLSSGEVVAIYDDVTEAKQLEEELRIAHAELEQRVEERTQALRDGEARLLNAQRIANLGSWDRDIATDQLYWSDQIYRIVGLEPGSEPTGYDGYLSLVHPDDRAMVEEAHVRTIATGEHYNIDHRIIRPDGVIRHVNEQGEVTFDDNGNPVRISGTVLDITDRKAAEEALAESMAEFRAVVESTAAAISLGDTQGRIMLVNDRFASWLGADRQEIIGRKVEDFLPPHELPGVRASDAVVMNGKVSIREVDRDFPDGVRRSVLIHKAPVINDDGAVIAIATVVTDITDRKRAEEELRDLNTELERRVEQRTAELRESETRLKAILDNSPAAIYLKDLDGRFLAVNKPCLDLHGPDIADVQGKTSADLFPEELARAYEALDRQAIETGVAATREVEELHEGESRTVSITKFPVFDSDGELVAVGGIDMDVTERKRLERELLHKERLAALGQLTATVSHELRNPLGVVRTSLYVLRGRLGEDEGHVRQVLDRIDRSVVRCDRIIDELLDFTRISDMEPEPTEIDPWLQAILSEQTLPGGISLRTEFGTPSTIVSVDQDRLRRAVINVFDNACQALTGNVAGNDAEKDGKTLSVTTRRNGDRIEIVVEDNGPGVPARVLAKVFEPLFSTKGFGVGLGLPVVKRIMEQHHGGVEFESVEGQGSSVCLWLPADETLR